MKKQILLLAALVIGFNTLKAQSWDVNGNSINPSKFLGTVGGSPEPDINLQTNGIFHSVFEDDGSFTVNGGDDLNPKINIGLQTQTSSNGDYRLSLSQGWNDWIRLYNANLQKYWSFHNPQGQNELVIGRTDLNNPGAVNPYPYTFTEDRGLNINQDWGDWLRFQRTLDNGYFGLHNPQNQDAMSFYYLDQNNTPTWGLLTMYRDGNVVIGDGVPSLPGNYKLYVKDGILTEKLKIALTNSSQWADFVFADDYELMSLNQVESYVRENKHLPNVPSAEKVVEQGLDLGKMDAKLLEKVEELTLYLIQQNKEIELLQKKVAELEHPKH